jgi:hypothetical protein
MSENCQVCGQPLKTEEEKDMGVHVNCSLNIVHDALS